ncbi:MAG: response regulator [Acetatifactor sp.]
MNEKKDNRIHADELVVPAFEATQAMEALSNTNIFMFRYFPKLKMIVLTERTSREFHCDAVCHNMPDSLRDKLVYEQDLPGFDRMYSDIDMGAPAASAEFRDKNRKIWYNVTITTVEWDESHKPEICAGVVEKRKEAKKYEQEKILQSSEPDMMDFLSFGVFAYTIPEHRVMIINEEIRRMFDYDIDGKISFYNNMMNHIERRDHSIVHAVSFNLKEPGDTYSYKFHSRLNNGRVLTISCETKLLATEDERLFILSIMQDITEPERTAKLLQRERRQYRDAVSLNSEYFFELDVTDGILYSDFVYNRNGVTMSSYLGVTFPISYDELLEKWKEKVKPEFLTPGEYNHLNSQELIRRYEQGMTHFSSEYYSPPDDKYLRKYTLLCRDETNGHIQAVIFSADITESIREDTRKRNELIQANRTLEKQMEITKAFSSIYFGSWTINLQSGEMLEISIPEWAHDILKSSGGKFAETVEILMNLFVDEECRKAMTEFLRIGDMAERLKDRDILSCEYIGKSHGWCVANLIPLKRDEEGNVLSVILAVRGIDAEKQLEINAKKALQDAYEAANRANIAKTNFLASMSHDIRTPMNAIIGMTAIAGTNLDDKEKVADCLSKITVSGKHLLGLINEVLDMNKLESDKLNLNAEDFNISELVDNLLTMSKPLIEEKHHHLTVAIQNVEHENVIGDSQRIQQVFMNLMGNAVKYTPENGEIKFTISEKPTNNPKIGCYEFVFEDNGIGMSKDFLPTIFEPFTRANDSRMLKIQGTGLGMPITKNIVRMMNGDIKVESELNQGTRVTVTILLELRNVDESNQWKEFAGLSVLVVNDDKVACESTCNILEELGMKGEWVLTGQEAVELVAERRNENRDFFAIIMDWKIPDMDGIATTRKMQRKVGEKLPIVIISAFDWSDIEYEARAAGVRAFISKPLFKSRVAHLFKTLTGQETQDDNIVSLKELNRKNFAGHRALVVEDNELNKEIAGEILGMTGMEIEYAEDGKQALDIMADVKDGYYDIIFMDIQMPFMNGYEATRAIRTLPRQYTKQVPIVAMTANAFVEDVQAAIDAGMNEHIAKPLDFDQLLKSLNHWIG